MTPLRSVRNYNNSLILYSRVRIELFFPTKYRVPYNLLSKRTTLKTKKNKEGICMIVFTTPTTTRIKLGYDMTIASYVPPPPNLVATLL